MAEPYITLVSSLPYLPPFERAERSPITRLRLEQRLISWSPATPGNWAIAEALVSWRMSLAKPKTDKEMVLRCRAAMQKSANPLCADYRFRIDQPNHNGGLRQSKTVFESAFL